MRTSMQVIEAPRVQAMSVEDRIVAAASEALAASDDWYNAYNELRDMIFANSDFAKVAFANYEDSVLRSYLTKASRIAHEAKGGGRRRQEAAPNAHPLRPSRGASTEAARRSLLDTMWVDGTRLGDVSAETARTWGAKRAKEARFITILTQGIDATDARPLRAVVTDDDAAEAMKRAGAA